MLLLNNLAKAAGFGPKGRIQAPAKKMNNPKGTLRKVYQYMKKQKLGILLVVLFVIISTLLSLLGPYYIGVIIDEYILEQDVAGTIRMSILLVGIYLATSLFNWLQSYIMIKVTVSMIAALREDLYKKMQILSLRFFDRYKHGELMSRFTNDLDQLNQAMSQSIIQMVSTLLTVTGVLIAMFSLNVVLALVALIMIPVMIVVTQKVILTSRKNFANRQRDLGTLNGFIEESISGGEVITLFSKEEDTFAEFHEVNEQLRKSAMRAEIFSGLLGPTNNFLSNLGLGILIAIGAILALKGHVTVGIIASFVTYYRQFARPINQLSNLLNSIQAGLAGAERVFETMDEVPDITDKEGAIGVNRFKGDIAFSQVNFSYQKGTPILKNINFQAKSGQMTALVGPTGSGKTTIINLLMRFYDIDSGKITIDQKDIKDYKINDLRKRIGIVLQDPYLFSGSIMENIRYGRLDATDEEVIEAAKIAQAHSFIMSMPNQYETHLTTGGTNISQGQKQLLSIARAVLADADILILDEATANIDTRTEADIQKGLKNLTVGKTCFVIAHRLKTIEKADLILVIKNGEIIEQGNHRELLSLKGMYSELYEKQIQI